MNINEQQILQLLEKGESIDVEFKECKINVNRSVYETICAFLNRHGGTILLGVQDSGKLQGIQPESLEKIKKELITTTNNPQKLYPPAYLTIDEVNINDKLLLSVYIPESSQVHRCNGRIYDRNGDSDIDITDYTHQVAQLYRRKSSSYSENTVYPHIQLEDLSKDLIERCRKLATVWAGTHPWAQMSDMELIQSAQLYQQDPETHKSGATLAGVLLLGPDQLILSTLPHHRTDLILRKVDVDRYDDRDLVRTNLIDSYDRIIAFVQKHLPDPFHLEGIERISLRDTIFREIASNLLIHREYTNAFPAKLIIEYGQVRTENANIPHGFGLLNPKTLRPFPKNPIIGAFFREIHRADELGSGTRKLMRYGKFYGGADPELIEGDIFQTIVTVPEFSGPLMLDEQKVTAESLESLSHNQKLGPRWDQDGGTRMGPRWDQDGPQVKITEMHLHIMHLCVKESPISDIMQACERTNRSKFRNQFIKPLLEAHYIAMSLPDKPSSKKQKYYLTPKGKTILKEQAR